ncbi:MAG: FHA domain-containing protein [Deltaproteobacteria bacterium]|nr:MAG: FHA domain-containing protein [Deltaproteobacteria bacterium]TMQ11789.1 MAG: FHA domain-containing protein [Deltaproteobacteria bacterium]
MEHERKTEDPAAGLESTERVSSASPSAPHLLIVAADGTWTSRPLPAGGVLTIGRGEVDVRVDERAVSRLHARLEIAGSGELRLIDLGSANGTVVGGRLVRSAGVTLHPGEPILVGRTVLSVHAPAGERAAEPAPRPLGTGPVAASVGDLVARAAPTLISVLLLGETGVGKDVVAERIHRLSTRAAGPLVRVNCAGLSAALLESDLFGHEKGAFTGATSAKPGLLEAAAGGTVFLDEIGEMPLEVQAKLLLVIEQRVVRRVGATRGTPIDVRFLSATHRDLEAEIRRDRFRTDFYYRINGLAIHIPPLRERRDEIDGLAALFADEAAAGLRRPRPPAFEPDARARLHHHDWPGNVRELRRVIERAVLFADGGAVTSRVLFAAGLPDHPLPAPTGAPDDDRRARLVAALAACGGNQSRAARLLGISRNTLIAWMRRFDLARPRAREVAR